ncbi:hypothetical protein pmac_cds_882 [Pandoravirus macleodensis]|uniref:Uncharacterized protein n=1 Tax=Pandoravirus macleodensis TaxID=2107707 RepID=A0A2U7UGQ5_9VIRU|nr:hypothetical protein pmac_cds_882 [Pandoravirus macleodensis]AVK77570.1 hypothetical protein pmac_cds_882 [Pandoravirus macleodensis]
MDSHLVVPAVDAIVAGDGVALERKRKKPPPPNSFDAALAALAGRGRLDRPYADDPDRRMGSIQRVDSVAGRLTQMRRSRSTTIDGALPLPAPLVPLANDDRARLVVDMLFGWLESIVLNDSVAWDAIDLAAAPDDSALTALVVAEWIDDCFCARASERRAAVAHSHVATHASVFNGQDTATDVNEPTADDVATAFWFMEQLEAGAWGDDTVCAREGLDNAQGDAICLRLAAASAVKHVAPDYEDVTEIFYDLGLGRTIARIGTTYRSALRARLARFYAIYRDLADAVDAARCAGYPAPPGRLPTPCSTQSWIATCPIESNSFARMWATSVGQTVMGVGDGNENAMSSTLSRTKRRCLHAPKTQGIIYATG